MSDEPPGASRGAASQPWQRLRKRFRPFLRGLHRDVGYFAVGLTLVYASSGLAVNHIADWDPSFQQIERTHQLDAPIPLPADVDEAGGIVDTTQADRDAAQKVLRELGRTEEIQDVYRLTETQLDIVLEHSTLHVETDRGLVNEEGQRPRPFLRLANWLHLNRGKQAWTYVADAYAVFLLFLAGSGLFMLPSRGKGLGRRGLLVSGGILLPVLYVILSGGP